jgi:small-conductance mechanosensitive channel
MDILKELNIDWMTTIIIILIFVGAAILTRVVRWFINKSFVTASEKLKVDPTRYKFFKNTTSLIIWFNAFGLIILLIPKLKALAIALFAGAGILVAILGFAAQEAFSNIINGIFIVVFKPFQVGDLIKVGEEKYGMVEDITLRHTIIKNFENKRIIIPNTVIGSETIVNDSIEDKKVCRWIEVGISYDSDVELATKIIQEEAMKHPGCIDVRTQKQKDSGEPRIEVRLMSFGDFSINLRAYVWADDPYRAFRMHSDINKAIKKRFDAEGVEIPFPYRTLVYKKDLPKNKKLSADK